MSDLLFKVKENLIVEHSADDELITRLISAAVDYAERYQHLKEGYYSEEGTKMSTTTEQGIIMLVSHWYESRDGSTGGFFADSVQAAQQVLIAVNSLLRLGRDWQV